MREEDEIAAVSAGNKEVLKSSDENLSQPCQPPSDSRITDMRPSDARRRLPEERRSLTHHFSVGGQEGYVTIGLFEDGKPGEMFIRMAKEGSTVSGLMDAFATAVSLALQYGVPLEVLCSKFSHTRFEPSGWTGNRSIGYAKSLMDYLFRWLELRFLTDEQGFSFELQNQNAGKSKNRQLTKARAELVSLEDAPVCRICGSLMVTSGSCYRCMECDSTSGRS
jgi:ribonucleoside-diphosphate reductase alpha chain